MHMLIYNKESDVLLERAISACRKAQNYVRPIVVDQNKYRSGVTCDQKLATLVSIANDTPSCAALRPALECLDDLVFQMKCVSMEPILTMVEEIEWNVNKLINERPSTSKKTSGTGEISKGESTKKKTKSDQWAESFYNFNDDSVHGVTSTASSDGTDPFEYGTRTSSNPDPFRRVQIVEDDDDDEAIRGGASFGEASDETSIVRESNDGNETEGSEINIAETLNASQAIINGLLSSLDDSGDTVFLELVKAALEKKDQDTLSEQKNFDSDCDATDTILRKTEDEISATGLSQGELMRIGSMVDSDIDFEVHDRGVRRKSSPRRRNDSRSEKVGHQLDEGFVQRLNYLFEMRRKAYRRMRRMDRGEALDNKLRSPNSAKRGSKVLDDCGKKYLEFLQAADKKSKDVGDDSRTTEKSKDSAVDSPNSKEINPDGAGAPKRKKKLLKSYNSTWDKRNQEVDKSSPSRTGEKFDCEGDNCIPQDQADPLAHLSPIQSSLHGKFFDRVHHLFEVRRKVRKRMDRIDPSQRLKKIVPTVHSGGILKEDGTYKTEYQQKNELGDVACNLAQIYAAARQCKSCFLGFLYEICDKVKGLDHFDAQIAPLKPHDRANEKAKSEYSHRSPGPCETWLYDVLRGTIMCKTVKQLESINKYLSRKAHIVQAKNRFATPAYNGYRDLLYHVRIPYEYKAGVFFIAEIQVQHRDVISLQNSFGLNAHQLYFRSCFAGRSTERTLNDLEQLHKHGKVDDLFIANLLESDDSEKLGLFAHLFHEKLECRDRSLELYSRVLKLQKTDPGEYHAKTGATYLRIGLLQCQEGDFETSLMNLNKALEIQQKVFGSRHPIVATTLSHIGNLICLKGEDSGSTSGHSRALRQHRRSLSIRQETLGNQHVDVATSYQNIGLSLGRLGDFDGSVTAYREAIRIIQNVLEPNHPDVAATHSMIGTVLCQQGKFDEAMKEFSRGHEIREERLGKHHPETADSHTEIGNMHCVLGDLPKAEWRHREALRIRGAIYGRDHPDYAVSLSNIGFVLNQKGDFDGALAEHQSALEIREATLGKRHLDTMASRKSIVAALNKLPEL